MRKKIKKASQKAPAPKFPTWVDYLGAFSTGILLFLSFPPCNFWALAWVAFVPLWMAILRSPSAKQAGNLGALAGLVFYVFSLWWFKVIFGFWAISFWCIFSLWIALHGVLAWFLYHKILNSPRQLKAGILWTLGLALSWVGLEYFRSEKWFLANAWLCLGYSQSSNLPVLQLASVAGVYGISALLVLSNAGLCLVLRGMKSMLWPILALLVICLSWGFWRVSNFPCEQGRPIKVALVQHEADELDRLVSFSLTPPAGAADLVVWPEYCFQVPLGTEQLYLNLVRQKLYGDKALFVIGAFDYDEDATPPQIHDYAWVFSSQEGVYGRYDKLHPIPFIERYLKGNPDPRPVNSPLGKLGLQVCYDLDFENGSRLMAKQGAEILAVPNMDPLQWGRIQHQQHSNMAPFRAVEEGLWVVRAASSGFSQIIDPVGRVLYSLPVGENGALTGQAWLDNRATFYNRAGWLLAPLCMILTGFMMVWFLVRMIFEKKKLKR